MSNSAADNESLEELRCLRCEGEMVAGWVPEHIGSGTAMQPMRLLWHSLVPTPKNQDEKQESFWDRLHRVNSFRDLMQLELTPDHNKLREGLPVVTMRCVRCGYLEAYARPAPAKPGQES